MSDPQSAPPSPARFGDFFQDDDYRLSSTRLVFVIWAVGVLGIWACVSIVKQNLQLVDPSVTAILGILMTGKVVQHFSESGSDSTPPGQSNPPPPPPAS